jgi:Zinc carboxypeptidase
LGLFIHFANATMMNRGFFVVVAALLLRWCTPSHTQDQQVSLVQPEEKKETWLGLRSGRINQASSCRDLKDAETEAPVETTAPRQESANATAFLTTKSASTKAVSSYRILSFTEINSRLNNLAKSYPNFIKVTTAQTKYKLQAAGGYLNYIATIQDYAVHPVGSSSSNRLPEVLLSGALHGDERVGPTTVVETARLLVLAAFCEAQPTDTCKKNLENMGIKDANRQWLARLVTTRRIVIVPTANAMGYAKGVREEGSVDPNRDFAFDQVPGSCMRSIAARTLNELFREHQFQLALTYHGGMEVCASAINCELSCSYHRISNVSIFVSV